MKTKLFGNKKIIIREFQKSDLRIAKKFQEHINSLVEEDAKLAVNKKLTLKEEKDFLSEIATGYKNKTAVYIVAEHNGKIIGGTGIDLGKWRNSHVAHFGISIRRGYRRIGLGKYLMGEAISLAKKKLKPKIIKLEVFANNKPAISLYKKMGFKKVAKIPKQRQYKEKLIAEIVMLLDV